MFQKLSSQLQYLLVFTNALSACLTNFPHSPVGKESACNAGDLGSIPVSGRSAGEGIDYPLQYSWASLIGSAGKQSICDAAGDLGSVLELGRYLGNGKG